MNSQINYESLQLNLKYNTCKFLTFCLIVGWFTCSSQVCTDSLFTILDNQSMPNANQAATKYRNLQEDPHIESVHLIEMSNVSELVTGSSLTCFIPLEEGGRCISFERYSVFSDSSDGFSWAGISPTGEAILINRIDSGFGGHFMIEDDDYAALYCFVALSENETALVKFDTSFVNGNTSTFCAQEPEASDDPIADQLKPNDDIQQRSTCTSHLIRVLFLFTNRVLNATGFNPQNVARNAIMNLNASLITSGVEPEEIMFELAGVRLLPNFAEGNQGIGADLNDLSNNVTANNLRIQHFADIVVLLTDNVYQAAGRAKKIGAQIQNAYAIATIQAAAGNFTAAHEIGHVIGGRHQRCITCFRAGCDILTPHHGFQIGDDFRTIMHQVERNCGGRQRIGVWSDISFLFNGDPTGNSGNQNTRVLRLRSNTVSCFYGPPSPPWVLTVHINGPSVISDCQEEWTWSSSLTNDNLTPPSQFLWEWSSNGLGGWNYLGNTESIVITSAQVPSNGFVLRLKVNDSTPAFGIFTIPIESVPCLTEPDHEVHDRSDRNDNTVYLFPNPSYNSLNVAGGDFKQLTFVNSIGNVVESFNGLSKLTDHKVLDISSIPNGIYVVVIEDMGSKQSYFKFVKL